MIALGYWGEDNRPLFEVQVIVPNKPPSHVTLQVDTASNCTILSEAEFDDVSTFKTKSVDTLAGQLPAYVVPNGSLGFYDVSGKVARISPVRLFLVKELKTTRRQRKTLESLLEINELITPPRYILGRDVLNDYLLVAHHPDLLLLTNEVSDCLKYVRKRFNLSLPIDFIPGYGESQKLYTDPRSK